MEVKIAAPIPQQHTQPEVVDFRNAAHGPRGYKCANKRKLDDHEEQVQAEGLPLQTEVSAVPLPKRRKTNNVVGVGQSSGRQWKEAGDRAGSLKNPLLSTTWDKKMQLKAERDAFKTMKSEAIAAHKAKLAKIRKQREEAKARKEANRNKSNVTQTVTSNATLRKMMKSKKERKKLQKADTLQEPQ